nr:hypothetical protein [Tanacetum cinerariifolium]
MHNNIMVAGSRDRPPMLAPGRYPQWRSRFLRYVDTRPNGEALRKCILSGPYKPTTVLVQAVEETDDSPAVPEHTTVETPINMSPENKAHFLAEKEAIHLILTGIGDDIYLTSKWSRFVTIVKQQHKLDKVSYHKLFDILKQYQNEVNELRAEKLARNANPLALVATAQADRDQYYQTSRSHRSSAPSSKPSIPPKSHTSTRHKGKEIAKPITPPSETASKEDSDLEQAQRDKDMQKNLSLIAKYFKKIYKPTNNNLRTSLNSKNKNVDTTPRFKNDNQSGQFGNQRMECRKPKRVKDFAYHKEKMMLCKQAKQGVSLQAEQYDWLANTDEEVDEQELESRYSYMAKIQEVPTADSGTDSEPVKQVQNDAGYNVFTNDLQHSKQSESVNNTCLVATDDSNVIPDSPDMCEDDIQNEQNDVKSDDERVALANLIANLKLDTKQTEFEKFKAFNDRIVNYDKLERKLNEALGQLAHNDTVIREGLKTKAYELSVVKEKHDELMKHSLSTKSHYEGLVKQKTKVITDLKLREEHDLKKMLSIEKQLKFLNEIIYKRSQSIQTIHMMAPKVPTYNGRPTFANPRYLKKAQSEIPCFCNVLPVLVHQLLHPCPLANHTVLLAGEHLAQLACTATSSPCDKRNTKAIKETNKTLAQEVKECKAILAETSKSLRESISVRDSCLVVLQTKQAEFEKFKAFNDCTVDYDKLEHLFRAPTAHDMEILIQTCLMPLAIKTQSDSLKFVHELKQEMHVDLKYNETLEKEIDELEYEKAEFSDMYDVILQECVRIVLNFIKSAKKPGKFNTRIKA